MWILFGLKKKGEDKGEGEEGEGREEKRKGEKRKGKGKDKCCLEKKKKKKERKPLLANHGILPMIICNGADWSSCLQLFMSCTWCISALAELHPEAGGEGHGGVLGEFEKTPYTCLPFSEQHPSERKNMFLLSYLCLMPAFFTQREPEYKCTQTPTFLKEVVNFFFPWMWLIMMSSNS